MGLKRAASPWQSYKSPEDSKEGLKMSEALPSLKTSTRGSGEVLNDTANLASTPGFSHVSAHLAKNRPALSSLAWFQETVVNIGVLQACYSLETPLKLIRSDQKPCRSESIS